MDFKESREQTNDEHKISNCKKTDLNGADNSMDISGLNEEANTDECKVNRVAFQGIEQTSSVNRLDNISLLCSQGNMLTSHDSSISPTIGTKMDQSSAYLSWVLPSNPLPHLTSNLPNLPSLRGYLPSNLNLPDFASVTSLPVTNIIPSFPSIISSAIGSAKKSWPQLRESVRNVPRRLFEVSGKVPFKYNFSPIRKSCGEVIGVRLYFISSFVPTSENTLIYCDVYYNKTQSNKTNHFNNSENYANRDIYNTSKSNTGNRCALEVFEWKPLIQAMVEPESHGSLNERRKTIPWGITSYAYNEMNRRFVFTFGGSLYYFDDIGETPHVPKLLETSTESAKINFSICPSNPDLIAYLSDGDIWVTSVKSRREIRLTTTKYNEELRVLSAGFPSYIMQEEFMRHEGYWWRAEDSNLEIKEDGRYVKYYIIYEEVDETDVEIVKLQTSFDLVDEFRFPKAGGCNATSKLKLVSFKYNCTTYCPSNPECREFINLYLLYPDYEYLVRCGWYSKDCIWVQLLDRSQKHLVLGICSITNRFPPQILVKEDMDYYVSVTNVLLFINVKTDLSPGDNVEFLWLSEKTGFRHIYWKKVQIVEEKGTKTDFEKQYGNIENDGKKLRETYSKLIETRCLTSGDWEVSKKDVWIDETSKVIYFVGLKDSPLERHLYYIKYNEKNPTIKRLTEKGYSHTSIVFDSTFDFYINIQSNISIPPFGYLNCRVKKKGLNSSDIKFEKLGLVLTNSVYPSSFTESISSLNPTLPLSVEHVDPNPGLTKPELFTYKLKESGDNIYGVIFKPEFMEKGAKYPCVLDIYGGPHLQVVSNSFKGVRHVRRHLLSSEGYVVCAFDCHGSHHRGVKFASYVYGRLGQIEIAEQVEVLEWLASETGYIDMTRVAIMGWSYGGYMSLMALAQKPEIFKIAIAGAPVTNWRLYNTAYTERHLQMPSENPKGYLEGCVVNRAKSFPDEENRLLLIHGLMDDNVHFSHTQELIQALIKAGKPYQLQIYPCERHSPRETLALEHVEMVILSFLQKYL